ncbi:Oxoglutarate/iron-dependent dioxygenase [uncultured Caudovirales phage]|uniref:Oxoglutarate/iron-dependent dioxygenase n=1 Tax=uncultured Caudovirales phage TaxID=2100421 RepID=A0A6J7WW86_9CAUD|nr:Oxoglutarate/iron-dependent dioxygenase [uncultured Caudovirales phage]
MDLRDFCYSFDNSLSDDACDAVIDIFRKNEDLHLRYDRDGKPNWTQMNFTQNSSLNPHLHNYIIKQALTALDIYKSKIYATKFWPESYSFEQFRIKHYKPDGIDQFAEHVDATRLETAKRYFAFFWYLNDVEVGGETDFPNLGFSVQPKKGRIFMFPPNWMYPHTGNAPVSNEKFLLSSYLHFDS